MHEIFFILGAAAAVVLGAVVYAEAYIFEIFSGMVWFHPAVSRE
ncbi:MAG: hypothetical protein QXM53_02130 [Thermofilaceae archaeon]